MPIWTDDEKAALMNSNDGFSDSAVYGGATIYGIFLNEYTELDAVGVGSSSPAFICPEALVPGAKKGTSISVNGTAYVIQVPKPDGAGLTTLILKKP